ncbi:hypothetical protein Cyrtocomes_00567 [Candidatus Cyrtobacter comes]|uniref:Zinc finger/thioredoxin putative domain-containing protein n=1 Tax=Candidatus Cyrtobacter comes TaxID=675776 RepID=A0ABU5L7U2_9RICK|nr:MJ0042-type zinc finger domain-containing protein [Candidatus Cyrtobacter comes]MDZ5762194.1 hypothetical protein [Candidatus Cyrtobacter comes]
MTTSIVCKSCGSEFYVDEFDITEAGRFVRCSVCEYEWLASSMDLRFVDDRSTRYEDDRLQRPDTSKRFIYKIFLVLGIMLCAVGLYYASNLDFRLWVDSGFLRTDPVYSGIALEDMHYHIEEIGDVSGDSRARWLSITLNFHNNSSSVKILDNVEIKGLSVGKREILSSIFSPGESIVPKGRLKLTLRVSVNSETVPSYIKIKHNTARHTNIEEGHITAISFDNKHLRCPTS